MVCASACAGRQRSEKERVLRVRAFVYISWIELNALPRCSFPYTDTLKVLEKWGPGCHFLGDGLDSSIDELEAILDAELARNPHEPPILALFTEFPSNPLLRSADLSRLRTLADKYDFLIVIDDTIGNFINVETLPFADIVVTSLSKLFSGDSNVMGGR
jgi:cystathionine gamma-synthase